MTRTIRIAVAVGWRLIVAVVGVALMVWFFSSSVAPETPSASSPPAAKEAPADTAKSTTHDKPTTSSQPANLNQINLWGPVATGGLLAILTTVFALRHLIRKAGKAVGQGIIALWQQLTAVAGARADVHRKRILALGFFVSFIALLYFRLEREVGWQAWSWLWKEGFAFFWPLMLIWGGLSVVYPKQSIPTHLIACLLLLVISHSGLRQGWQSLPSLRDLPSMRLTRPVPTASDPAIRISDVFNPLNGGQKTGAKKADSVVVIAKPGQWSKHFLLPTNVQGMILPKGKVRIKTLSGKEWTDGPAEMHKTVRLVSKWDRTLSFLSLEDGPVEVVIDWEEER